MSKKTPTRWLSESTIVVAGEAAMFAVFAGFVVFAFYVATTTSHFPDPPTDAPPAELIQPAPAQIKLSKRI